MIGEGYSELKEEERRFGKERKMSIFYKIFNIGCELYMRVNGF